MAAPDGRDAFFVGYLNAVPRPLGNFLARTGLAVMAAMALLGVLLSLRTADPGWAVQGYEHIEVRGLLEMRPYPLLRSPGGDTGKARTYLLAGEGKYGVGPQAAGLEGREVMVAGYLIKRGTLDMLLVDDAHGITALEKQASHVPPVPVSLGRWRLTGEICDGKCYGGAMSPGTGLAHKACANLCLLGDVPPVFVSTGLVGGSEFFLLTDSGNGTDARRFADYVGRLVAVDGEVERVDNFFVFKADIATLKGVGR